MLSVTNKPNILSVVLLSVVILSVVAPMKVLTKHFFFFFSQRTFVLPSFDNPEQNPGVNVTTFFETNKLERLSRRDDAQHNNSAT
jgi:hypothetical protein